MRRLTRILVVVIAAALALVGCGTVQAPGEREQKLAIAELQSRGFMEPKYLEVHNDLALYGVTLDDCRLTIGEKDGTYVWLAQLGNNPAWDFTLRGDEQVNAAWLRGHPSGLALSEVGQREYDLTSCLKPKSTS